MAWLCSLWSSEVSDELVSWPNHFKYVFELFQLSRYTRNLIDTGHGKYNLILLCWSPGQGTRIHDHSNSHCFMKVSQKIHVFSLGYKSLTSPQNLLTNKCASVDTSQWALQDFWCSFKLQVLPATKLLDRKFPPPIFCSPISTIQSIFERLG